MCCDIAVRSFLFTFASCVVLLIASFCRKTLFCCTGPRLSRGNGSGFGRLTVSRYHRCHSFHRRSRISNREGAMVPRPAYLHSNGRSGGLSLVRRSSLQQG